MRNILFILFSLLVLTTNCSKDNKIIDTCFNPDMVGMWELTDEEKEQIELGMVGVGKMNYFRPVCGCDGKFYGNKHSAENAGMMSWTDGACKK